LIRALFLFRLILNNNANISAGATQGNTLFGVYSKKSPDKICQGFQYNLK